MQHRMIPAALAAAIALLPAIAAAQDGTREINGLTGPAAPVGLSVEDRGALLLGREYADNPVLSTRALRSRVLILEPGGVVPIHSHTDRPAVTLVLVGEVIEHRSDTPDPIVRREGDVTFDGDGLSQWWENQGDEPVVFYVIDFFDTGTTPDH